MPEIAQTVADQAAAKEALPADAAEYEHDDDEVYSEREELRRRKSFVFKLIVILVSIWLLGAAITAVGGWTINMNFAHEEKVGRPTQPSKPEIKSSAPKKEKAKVRSKYRRQMRSYNRQKRKYERYVKHRRESELPVWQLVLIWVPIVLIVIWAVFYLATLRHGRFINIGNY
jgi:fatty acid desaturase